MIPEIGNFALIVALFLSLIQGVLPILGAARNDMVMMGSARTLAVGQLIIVAVAFGCLLQSFVANDFSVLYVAEHSNSQLPVQYRIAAIWGGHEGSLLLWTFILTLWTVAVATFSKHLPQEMVARVIGVMGLVSTGFLLFMLLTSNPFDRLLPAAMDGQDLNPLLQDPGLVIHPPMLYMGYVGFSVAFAFALSALLGGKLDSTWARWSRPWTTVAWVFMTIGIVLGSGWAYYELGWGGWWFWDPVENASFMPWLVGTALMHSLAVTEKRGAFKSWTVLLAIAAFSLSLLGTFLVRSGVLSSVHAFATDPKRGIFILSFLVVVIGSSLLLFAWRAPKIGLGGKFDIISRESMLLTNNVLLSVASASVFLGTLYPLFMDALGFGKLSVGPPYFQTVFVPLMVPMVMMMGLGPVARWKQASLPDIWQRVRWALAASMVIALLLPLVMGKWTPLIALGLLLAAWVITTAMLDLRKRIAGSGTLFERLKTPSRSYYGMLMAHLGIAVFIIGVTMVKGYETERDVRMDVGDTVAAGGYEFRFDGVSDQPGPNYMAAQGRVTVRKDGKIVTVLQPEKRNYNASGMPMTEASIEPGFLRDLYVSLGEPIPDTTAWAVRVYIKPFVDWIWLGCLMMALGGVLAISDRRYRIHARKTQTATANSAQLKGEDSMMRFILPLVVFLVLAGFLYKGLHLDPHEVPSPLIDKPAPAFNLPQLQETNKLFSPAEMKGKVWLLNAWSSWCVSCKEEHPVLMNLAQQNIVPIYGLDYKDKREDALMQLSRGGNPYVLSVMDREGRTGIDYGVYGVPETYVIDKQGIIRYKQIGPVNHQNLRETILPLVAELQKK